ncbi:hypothetical protein Asd1617_00746 [Shigella dysenteriae 1617]|uniref:Uncharacterized protein n=1 Tax=Shigella dysenteriae 1617 TaxID=754093 RepID=A0A0A6ZNB4_SHIDY|nr:hypothetical protein Asd1617_00746 [Shigella dysenteriae 1617]
MVVSAIASTPHISPLFRWPNSVCHFSVYFR